MPRWRCKNAAWPVKNTKLDANVALVEAERARKQTSAQAASALRPIAGEFAFLLFSLGIIGTGLLAVPVLAGSAAYAMAGTFRWRNSLELKPTAAKRFYAISALSTLAGVAQNLLPIDPINALFWSPVINGVISVPIMVVMMLLASRLDVMGQLTPSLRLKPAGLAEHRCHGSRCRCDALDDSVAFNHFLEQFSPWPFPSAAYWLLLRYPLWR